MEKLILLVQIKIMKRKRSQISKVLQKMKRMIKLKMIRQMMVKLRMTRRRMIIKIVKRINPLISQSLLINQSLLISQSLLRKQNLQIKQNHQKKQNLLIKIKQVIRRRIAQRISLTIFTIQFCQNIDFYSSFITSIFKYHKIH